MAKQLDPNHLALMRAATDARDLLRQTIPIIEAGNKGVYTPEQVETMYLNVVDATNILRMAVKGRG